MKLEEWLREQVLNQIECFDDNEEIKVKFMKLTEEEQQEILSNIVYCLVEDDSIWDALYNATNYYLGKELN